MHPFYGAGIELTQDSNMWWLNLISMAMYLFFWAVVIIIAFKLYRKHIKNPNNERTKEDSAIQILRVRYAKGEIDSEEFNKIKSDLDQL